jgi:hypothetical protein
MSFAADCLSHTGVGGTSVLVIAGIALLVAGAVALATKKSWLSRTSLILAPLLIIAALTFATPAPAQALQECGTSTPTATPTPVAAIAPIITNDPLEYYTGYQTLTPLPFTLQITATGDTPLSFAFDDPTAAAAIHLAMNPSTGLVTETGGNGSTCLAVSLAGGIILLDITATNLAGADVKTFRFICDS